MTRRDFAMILLGVAAIYLPLSFFPAPDIRIFLTPWLHQLRETGFSVPVGNYSPPYLYMLWAVSFLPDFLAVKLLAIVGVGWLAWCVGRFAQTLDCDPLPAAAITLIIPSVIFNGPVIGQCDTFWTGCCVLAVAEAIKGRAYRMALWAGVAFAFKAQAAFMAPFCIGYIIHKRAWSAVAIPPAIYLLAILPAFLAGWPIVDLLTVYLRQPQITFIGDAANLWAIAWATDIPGPSIFPIGYALGICGAAFVIFRRGDPLLIALLSALLIPFLLPKMLERFFFLADILAFVLAYTRRDRFSISLCILVQAGSVCSIIGALLDNAWPTVVGSLFMAAALTMLGLRHVERDRDNRRWRPSLNARDSVAGGDNKAPQEA